MTHIQSRGRGRRDRIWTSTDENDQPTGLAVTFGFRPAVPSAESSTLGLIAGAVAREAIASASGKPLLIKWPNDLLLQGQKVGGLLVERLDGIDLIGIGVNTAQTMVGQAATPVGHLDARRIDLLSYLGRAFMGFVSDAQAGWARHRPEVNRHLAWHGEEVVATIRSGQRRGILEGIGISGLPIINGVEVACDSLRLAVD